ncbi:prolyl oligopeptidase family serine peptidase [Verrucomicrobiota bacterium sgz303538]
MKPALIVSLLQVALATAAVAEPLASSVKPIPPPGIEIPADVRSELSAGVDALGKEIAALQKDLANKPELLADLTDVQIFHKAVDWALRFGEFFDAKQVDAARKELSLGMERVKALRSGQVPWNAQTGLVVRGYKSKIDGSIQPYGLVIPENWSTQDKTPRRLDFWFHGRGEKLSELAFLEDRMKNKGEFTPESAIVVHLYGRYCNANKFAGETDLFEALEDVRRHYPIDMNRLVVRGFSMGGAACWQFATHHAGLWAATAPGAGFAETAEFFRVFAAGKQPPPWWEQVLWRWYDSTLYAGNLANCTTVAYSGEIDGQKQAADIMIRFLEKEGLTIPHIIGPQTPHKYHAESKPKIEEIVTAAAQKGREVFPKHVRFTTYSLLYPRMEWLAVSAMEKQWERADINADVTDDGTVEVKTSNIAAFDITVPQGANASVRKVVVDGQKVAEAANLTSVALQKAGGKWTQISDASKRQALSLHKTPSLCGPVDHALMSRFVMVRPTGKPLNDTVGNWANAELEHATGFWRKVFRGEAPVKDDRALTDEEIRNSNLILWGDPSSNAVLAKILPKLPIQWTKDGLVVGKQRYDAAHTAPILIFPNPLNPERYVVLNSGVTFREQALLNNSDQTPKLPDWAVVDLRTPPGPVWPGEVVDAGFFNEDWRLQ